MVDALVRAKARACISDIMLCRMAGVSEDAMNRLRSGKNRPRLATIEAIAGALGYRVALVEDR